MPFDTRPLNTSTTTSHGSCLYCPTSTACLSGSLTANDRNRWNGALLTHIPLTHTGKSLFTAGEIASAVYVVRAGCIKSCTVDDDGNEHVRGFHLPGDLVGLDALGASHYPASAIAVTPSQICRLPRGQLQTLMATSADITQHLMGRVSRDLRLALAISGNYSAEQRVAAFLLYMQERLSPGSMAPATIRLPMPRRDIANYLRLATETVCRVLTRFEEHKQIVSNDKTVRLLQPVALWNMAEPVGICQPRMQLRAAA